MKIKTTSVILISYLMKSAATCEGRGMANNAREIMFNNSMG